MAPESGSPTRTELSLWTELQREKGDGRAYRMPVNTRTNGELTRLMKMLADERSSCNQNHQQDSPPHDHVVVMQSSVVTIQCPSGCRWYDPTTGEMAGTPHCTCDECF